MRGLRHLSALTLLLATTDARADGVEFGVVPSFHLGRQWVSFPAADGTLPSRTGTLVEANLTALAVFPGDRFAFAVTGGYVGGGSTPEGIEDDVGYSGLQVLPTVMVSLLQEIYLQGRFGAVFAGGVSQNQYSYDATLLRFGGGLTFIPIRMHSADVAFSLDVMRTQASLDVSAGPVSTSPKADFGATSVSLGVSMTFNGDAFF